MKDLSSYIQIYSHNWKWISERESYKWIAFKNFKENHYKKFGSFNEWINVVFGKADNLLTSYRYLPFGMLQEFSGNDGDPQMLYKLFENLMQAKIYPTVEIVYNFINGTKLLMQTMASRNHSDWNGRKNLNTYQDAHAVSVYLSMFYPNDFYIYKYSIFRDFAKIVGVPIIQKDAIERLFEYQTLCNAVKNELKKNESLIEFYRYWLKDHNYEDDNLNLLTQDFIYSVVTYLNSDAYKKIKGNKKRVGKLMHISASKLNTEYIPNKYSYKGMCDINYSRINKQNESVGYEGELWVVNFEKERLEHLNLDPNRVEHSSKEKGDGCGYDVLSVEDDGITPRYIEVKTTSGNISQPLFFSDNERRFSIDNKDHYYLYRVYNFKSADNVADLTIIKASLDELNAEPISYKARILPL